MDSGRQVQVVLVEDSPAMQSLIQAQVEEIPGVKLVGIATGPVDGLRLIDKHQVDLVIADMFLHNGTAIELLEHLSERQRKPLTIIITNTPSIELREHCLSLGASGFFDKAHGFDWLPGEVEGVRRQWCSRDQASSSLE